jgi:hypothetical protein
MMMMMMMMMMTTTMTMMMIIISQTELGAKFKTFITEILATLYST